jgi:peptidoglycan/LPS O-acetylase OafA/YrhL
MLGTLKFLLAIAVMLSHCGLYLKVPGFHWFHHGVSAVIGFYIVSGYITKFSYNKKFNQKSKAVFYKDRIRRIFPQYYFFAFASLIFLLLTGYISLNFKLETVLSNLLLLPINLDQLIDVSFFKNSYDALVPQAWYLGTELQFYLLAPFLFEYMAVRILSFTTGIAVFLLAAFQVIDTRLYGSRMLPGVLIFYLTGSILYDIQFKKETRKRNQIILALLWLGSVILYLVLRQTGNITAHYNGPVLLGYIFLTPVIYLLTQRNIQTAVGTLLGKISYGMYLCHFLLIWLFGYFKLFRGHPYFQGTTLVILSIIAGAISFYLIDKQAPTSRLATEKKK